MSLVTIYTAFSSADAQLVRSRLAAAGIEAQVADEIASLSMEGYSLAAGGIRIQVPNSEEAAARELIADLAAADENDESA